MRSAAPWVCLALLGGWACAKQGRTFYTEETMARVRAKIAKYDWAKAQPASAKGACEWVLKMSDQELWDFVPPPEQARALNVSFGQGCPVHGKEVFRRGGHYPWIMSRDKPFKVKCPVGGEEYPSNDFEPWNLEGTKGQPESGPGFVDRGLGWVDDHGKRYWFVGYYIFWQRWQRDIMPAVRSLAQAYLLTGEPVYAHKCAVLLARIAGDYERFDYPTQAYHNGRWPAGISGRILDHIWETGVITRFAQAYDAIYPALSADKELLAFLQGKGITDPRRHIETKMLNVMAGDIMRGFVRGNMGMHQRALATVAIVLDNDDPDRGPTTAQMRDWIMSGGGDVEYVLWNGFYRDGHGGESSPGYSSGWCVNFYQIAELLPRLGVDIWSNPKVKKMADIGIDLTIAGEFAPSIGDCGSILGAKRIGWSKVLQGPAFEHYKEPRYAKVLSIMGAKAEDLWEHYFDEEKVQQVVSKEGTDLGLKTRNLGGYGLAVLESGEAASRRGVCMYYGHAGGGHGHRDRLTIEMFAYGRPMLTDMGYPAHWLPKNSYWTSNTISHYCVVVDEAAQKTVFPGYLNTLASCPGVQLMDASAEKVAYPGTTSVYRRTSALIDLSPENSYLLDIFRVRGGRQHDWSFHGPPFPEFSVAGAEPGPMQEKGTLAGEDVAFGERPPTRLLTGGMVLNLRQAEGVLEGERPYAERSVESWAGYTGQAVLTRKVGARMSLSMPELPAGKVKVFLHAYDYNAGVNEVEIAVGPVKRTFRWEPSGQVGYRWLSEVYDLPRPADQMAVTAGQQGQSYILVDSIALSRRLDLEEPLVSDPASSGFSYLFHVRRMKPQGSWSATWRQPEEDLALTMTMPAGCAQEIILADAEPELKPGHPETLQYVLGRNQLRERGAKPAGGLASTYVAIVEPHRGPAAVAAVKRLTSPAADEWAVGLEVGRGGERDLIHSSLETEKPVEWQGAGKAFQATGEFALVTVDGRGVSRACLVNGTLLRYGDFVVRVAPSPTGRVVSVDHARNAVTVDAQLRAPGAYRDKVIILGNELHQTSYTIKRAQAAEDETTIAFGDTLFVIGMGRVIATDQAAGTVATDTQLTGYGRVDGGKHAGRWLYNEDKSRGFRIADFSGGKFKLEGVQGDLEAIFRDYDGDGRRQFWISDIGPGDTFRIPVTTYVARVRPGVYEVQMGTEVRLTVPASASGK